MKTVGIKLFWVVGAVLLVAVVAMGWLCPWLFPAGDEGNLYRRYEHSDHVEVTFLHNFRVNDSVAVDVTMISALDSTGWDTLVADFNITVLPPQIQKLIDEGKDFKTVRMTPREHLGQPRDSTNILNNYVIGISRVYKNVSIFHVQTLKQINDVLKNQFP